MKLKDKITDVSMPWVAVGDAMLNALNALDARIGCGCGGDYGTCNSCKKAASEGEKAVVVWSELRKASNESSSARLLTSTDTKKYGN